MQSGKTEVIPCQWNVQNMKLIDELTNLFLMYTYYFRAMGE
jgi:hypothetical protein